MERRALLAFVLCGLVLFAWRMLQPEPLKPLPTESTPTDAAPEEPTEETPPPAEESPAVAEPAPVAPAGPFAPYPAEKSDAITVETDRYFATFTNEGGRLRSLKFKTLFNTPKAQITNSDFNGHEKDDPQSWLEILKPQAGQFSLGLADLAEDKEVYKLLFKVKESDSHSVTFVQRTAAGLEITRRYQFTNESYAIQVETTVKNLNSSAEAKPLTTQLRLYGAAGITTSKGRFNVAEGLIATGSPGAPSLVLKPATSLLEWNDDDEQFEPSTPDDATAEKEVLWTGSGNTFFAAILIPTYSEKHAPVATLEPLTTDLQKKSLANEAQALASLTYPKVTLAAGEEKKYQVTLYVGPRDDESTQPFADRGLGELNAYRGFLFTIIGKPIEGVLKFILNLFQSVFINWGIAIILLTALVRLFLHPLTKKAQVTMHHMNKLKPLIEKLRKKYKNDKPELNKQMMALYRDHNVNMMAGCLPMLIQLPIMIGLFQVLRQFGAFRHAVFIPGIFVDLAAQDHILKLPFGEGASFNILFFELSFQYLNILPIIMIVLWVLQQQKMPKSDDPQVATQQKMMKYMVVVFGVMLYNYQSGLALYMITSTSIGIAEQVYIKKHLKQIDEKFDAKKRDKEIVKNKGITVKTSGKRKPK